MTMGMIGDHRLRWILARYPGLETLHEDRMEPPLHQGTSWLDVIPRELRKRVKKAIIYFNWAGKSLGEARFSEYGCTCMRVADKVKVMVFCSRRFEREKFLRKRIVEKIYRCGEAKDLMHLHLEIVEGKRLKTHCIPYTHEKVTEWTPYCCLYDGADTACGQDTMIKYCFNLNQSKERQREEVGKRIFLPKRNLEKKGLFFGCAECMGHFSWAWRSSNPIELLFSRIILAPHRPIHDLLRYLSSIFPYLNVDTRGRDIYNEFCMAECSLVWQIGSSLVSGEKPLATFSKEVQRIVLQVLFLWPSKASGDVTYSNQRHCRLRIITERHEGKISFKKRGTTN